MPARCEICDEIISEERAKIIAISCGKLPMVCLEHSTVTKPKGYKTAGEVVVVPDNPEALRQAQRAYRRAR